MMTISQIEQLQNDGFSDYEIADEMQRDLEIEYNGGY